MKIESHLVSTHENKLPSYISINPKNFYGVILQLKDNETNQVISEVEISKDAYKLGVQQIIDCMNLVKDEISDRFTLTFFLQDEQFVSVQLANAISTLMSDIVRYQNTDILYEGDDKGKQEECCCHDCDNCTCHSGDTEIVSEDMTPNHSADVENTKEIIQESHDTEDETKEESSLTSETEENPSSVEEPKETDKINLANLDISTLKQLVETTISIEFADLKFSRADIITAIIENSGDSETNVSDDIKKKINVILATLEKNGKIVVVRKFLSKTQPTLYSIVKGSE